MQFGKTCHVICQVLYIVLGMPADGNTTSYSLHFHHNNNHIILRTLHRFQLRNSFSVLLSSLPLTFSSLSAFIHIIPSSRNTQEAGRKWCCSPRKSRATHTDKIPHTSWDGRSTRRIHTMRSRIPME